VRRLALIFLVISTFAAATAIGVLAGTRHVLATTYYVDPAGSDSNAGTSAAPWAHICYGITQLAAGDTLIVNNGVYREDCREWNGSAWTQVVPTQGTSGSPVTVKSGAGNPVLEGLLWIGPANYWTFDNIDVRWSSTQLPATIAAVGSGAAYTPTSSDHMVKLIDGTGWTWKNSEFYNSQSYANVLVGSLTSGQPSNWTFSNNCVHDNVATGNSDVQNHDLYIDGNSQNGSGLVTRNIFSNAPRGEDVKVAGASDTSGTNSVTMTYNTMYYATKNILVGGPSHDNLIDHNLLVEPTATGEAPIDSYLVTGTNNVASNNGYYDSDGSGYGNTLITDYPQGNPDNPVSDGGGNVNGSPGFNATAACDDFRPTSATVQNSGVYAGLAATPTFRSSSSSSAISTNLTLNKPAGVVQNDVMIAEIEVRAPNSITAPTGWTLIHNTTLSTSGQLATYYKVAGASEPSSYTWSSADPNGKAGGITDWYNVNTSSPVDTSSGNTGTGTADTAPAITTAAANEPVLLFAAQIGEVTFSPPNGTYQRYQAATSGATYGASVMAGDLVQPIAGSTAAGVATASSGGGGWLAQLVALKPKAVPTFRSASSATAISTSLTINKPAGVVQNDVMVAEVAVRATNSITAPTGWTLILDTSLGSSGHVSTYSKVAGASEPSSYTWTSFDANGKSGGITDWFNVKTSSPVDVSSGNTGTGTTVTGTGVTTTGPNEPILFFADQIGEVSYTPPAGTNERWDVATSGATYGASTENADSVQALAGSTGNFTATASSGGGGWLAQVVALTAQ